MRKSFTRFLSVFMLFCAFGLQAALAVGPTFDGVNSIPKAGASNVKPGDISTQFVLAYSATPAITGIGTMVISKDGAIYKVVALNSANVSVAGKTLVVKHGIASFTEKAVYSIVISSGVTVGGVPVTIGVGEYDFTIGDFTAPKLVTGTTPAPLDPKDGATGVKANLPSSGVPPGIFRLTMNFDEDVQIGEGDLAVYNANGTVVELMRVQEAYDSEKISIDGGEVIIDIATPAYFDAQTDYYVKVDQGAFVDASVNKNKYLGITNNTAWNFSTRDESAPVITASVSSVAATTANLNVSISEAGKVSYKVQTTVGAVVVIALTDPVAVAANTPKVFALPGLTGGVKYDVFVISQNNETPPNVSGATDNKVTFTTKDNTGPLSLDRGLITTAKKTTGAYYIFDEQVVGGTGTLAVRKVLDNTLIYSVPASAVTSSKIPDDADAFAGKWKVVMNFGGALASLENYYIVFPSTYIKDLSGNNYGSTAAGAFPVPVNYDSWVFPSSDFEAPVVDFATTTKATATTSNITGAGLNDEIFINFNEAVVLADGLDWPGGSTSDFPDWSKYVALQKDGINIVATYDYNGSAIVISPYSSLTSNTTYTVVLRAGVVRDISVNKNVLADAKTITVTTGDLDVLTATFAPGSDPLVANTPLTVEFNKAVRAIKVASPGYEALTSALVKSNLTLEKGINGTYTTVAAADYTAVYDASAKKITVTPLADKLWPASNVAETITYKLSIPAGFIEDNGGNDLAATSNIWGVKDYKKPVATLVANELLYSDPLTIKFDEPISFIGATDPLTQFIYKMNDAQGSNLGFNYSIDGTGKIVTIAPTTALEVGKTYYYGVGASMEDAAGNVNLAAYKSFKAIGVVLPDSVYAVNYTVNGGTPTAAADKFSGVTLNSDGKIVVKVNFNTAIRPKDLVAINTVATTLNASGVVIATGNVSGQVLTVTITPSPAIASSEPGTDYTVTVPQFLVEANAAYTGTTFAQMKRNVVIKLKTKDTQLPTVTASLNGLTGVAMDAGLKLTFSEPVTPVAGETIKFNFGAGPTTAESVGISASNVVKDETVTDGTVWVVKHANFDQYNTLYTIVVAKNAFKDAAANNLGGTDVTFTFTTVANPAPVTTTLYPADNSDMAPLSLDLNMVFSESIVQASITGSRKLVYVIEKTSGATRASIDGITNELVIGSDVQTYYAYVDETAKVVVSGGTVTIKGVTLAAGKEYYVLITPGAFKDQSLPTGEVKTYAGITAYGVWNFTTSDVYAPEVALSFTKLGADGLATTDSDIKLTFTKKIIKNVGGGAIANSDLSSLVKLEKWTGSAWQNLAYTGTVTNENVITVDNSSLVLLGEMKTGNKYRIYYSGTALKGKVSGTTLGAFGGDVLAPQGEFWTTDATAPTAPVIAFKNANEVTDVSYNSTDGDVILLNIAATDQNSGLTDHTAIKVYYLKSSTDATLSATDVKGLAEATKSLAGNGNFDVTYKGGMTSKTSYYVYAVAEDVAGNLSAVTKKTVITDDRDKPVRVGNLPTAFDSAKKITLTFNEHVVPVSGAKVRVIDNATGIVYLADLANQTGDNADANKINIVGGAFVQMSDDVAHYTIEIDPGMIVDVPRTVSDVDVNTPNTWDGIVGTSFQVASTDRVAPLLESALPVGDVALMPTFTLTFNEAVNTNSSFTQYVIYEDLAETVKLKSATSGPIVDTPYDILTATNVSGMGTSTITLNTNRALVSGNNYYLVIKNLTFSDLSGNKWDNEGDEKLYFTGLDNVPVDATFMANATDLPAASALSFVPSTLTIDLGEAFYLISDLDPNINTFELQSHIYLNQNGSPVSFKANQVGNTIVLSSLNGATGLGDAAKGKSFAFGFVNLYDENKNVNTGQEATFAVKSDAVVDREVTFIPGDNDDDSETEVNIPVDQTFKVEFNGLLYTYNDYYPLNNLLMTVKYLKDNNVFTMDHGVVLDVVSLEVVGGKHVVTLKPTKVLVSETTYDLEINSSWDDSDENLAGIQIGQGNEPLDYYFETFRTADVDAPKLVADEDGKTLEEAYLPVKDGVVGQDQKLALVFDEEVVGAGTVLIHRWDGVLMASVDITGVSSEDDGEGWWTINIGTPANIMLDNPLFVTNVKYYIEVPAGAIQDVAAVPNNFAGIVTVNEWSFTLMDDSTPQVVFVDDTKDGLAVNTKIKLTFDRPVELGKGWLALYYEDGKAVDLVRTSAGSTAMSSYDFTLNRELAPNTKFLVELGAGTFDLAVDNSIKQEQKSIGGWYFSTEVNSVPVAETYLPAKTDPMTTGVALTSGLSITFDQDVIAGTGNIQLHRKQNVGGPIITNFDVADPTKVSFVGNTLTIAGSVLNLQNNSEYYVIIPGTAVKNTSSTPEFWGGITVPFVWQFTTLNDAVAPTAVYAPKTTGLKPAEVVLTMTFNEPVVAGTGSLVIHNAATDAVVETIAITQAMLAGQVVTVTPTTLVESTNYYVQVAAGTIKDLAGNNFAGVTNKTDWAFATGDFTAPTVLSFTPTGTIADNHPTFVVTFNGPVVYGTAGNLKVYKVGSTAATLTIPVTAAMVSGSVVTVTYAKNNALVGGLDKNTAYYVTVDAGLVKDAAGNVAPGITLPTTWTFTTGATFATSIEPNNVSLEFKVYPNPFVEYVDFKASFVVSKVVVTNIAGQTVKQVINPDQRIQLNELRSGVYFMSVYDMDNTVKNTAKIVKR